jgi:hypothetical protein
MTTTIPAADLYIGVGNTITAQMDDENRVSGIVSRRCVVLEPGVNAVEIAIHWAVGPRTFVFVPHTAIVEVNGNPVRIEA